MQSDSDISFEINLIQDEDHQQTIPTEMKEKAISDQVVELQFDNGFRNEICATAVEVSI